MPQLSAIYLLYRIARISATGNRGFFGKIQQFPVRWLQFLDFFREKAGKLLALQVAQKTINCNTLGVGAERNVLGQSLLNLKKCQGFAMLKGMDPEIEFNPAAFKHGYTEADIRWAFKTQLRDVLMDGFDNKYLLIGFDTAGNIIEVMYNRIDWRSINVFHTMKARQQFLDDLDI
jgi:hypothetical protein